MANKKRKNKVINKYKKYSDYGHKGRILNELAQDDVVYILGDKPTYLHSTKEHYIAGLKTATRILNDELNKLVGTVQNKINLINIDLNKKVDEVIKFCNKTNWEEFKNWWENDVMGFPIEKDPVGLYYLGILNKIKENQTKINLYSTTLKNTKKSNLTQTQSKQLQQHGFLDSTLQFTPEFKQLMSDNRKLIKELNYYITNNLADDVNYTYIELAYKNLQNAVKNSSPTFSSIAIGRFEEFLTAALVEQVYDGIAINFSMLAGEISKGKKDKKENTKTYKVDTGALLEKNTIDGGYLSITLPMSDKTGMGYVFGQPGTMPSVIDQFTASVKTDTLKLFSNELYTADILTIAKLNPEIDGLFQYIIRNADMFGLKVKEQKDLIFCFFAWAKIIIELVGDYKSIDSIPVVIKFFNRIYKTSDVLNMFKSIKPLNILSFVNKSYLASFYSVQTTSKSANLLYNKKRDALQKMNDGVTYKKLKNAINDTLGDFYNSMPTRTIDTSFRIIMDNINKIR